jgi:murein DD-endopeptidase MepM/ murein hydrolase activator NlpD
MHSTLLIRRAGVERLEPRVLFSGPPEKFVLPIGGTPGVDWAITAYTDQDPRADDAADYRGRQYTFEGSESVHFALGGYASMDRGIDAYAAAAGTIVEAHDGEFDRHHAPVDPSVPDNYVMIDHGAGWQTRYGGLRNGSVAVSPGQVVAAGQRIGLVGGSGGRVASHYQFGPYLDFKVTHDGQWIETFLEPDAFWQSPPPFAGDAPAVHYMATTETLPTNNAADGYEVEERISSRSVFHPGERVYALTVWHGLNREAPRQYRYYRPDGTQVTDTPNTATQDYPQVWRVGWISLTAANAQLGTWQVAALLNGVELGRTSFVVANPSDGEPEMKLYQGTTYVIDGRTTPLDFGAVQAGDDGPRYVFTVRNHGGAPLALEGVTVPQGFSLVTPPPATVPAYGTATFELELGDRFGGRKSGMVTLRCNDGDEGEFTFAVEGTVIGPPQPAEVVGRQVFYGRSVFDTGEGGSDDAALASDKQALLERLIPSFANVTSYTRGINGLMIDVLRLPAGLELDADDFFFDLRDAANGETTGLAPAPSSIAVRRGAGVNGSDRVILTWPDGAIKNTWLGVGMLSTPATGLAAPDTFTFGNLVGETGDGDPIFRVNALDLAAVKRALNTSSTLTGRFDFNRDGRVNALDVAALKQNLGRSLAAATAAIVPFAAAPIPMAVRRVWDETPSDLLG